MIKVLKNIFKCFGVGCFNKLISSSSTANNGFIKNFMLQCLWQKLDELRNFVRHNPVDRILIHEARCKNAANFNIQNYKTCFTPSIDNNEISPYGGTTIFVSRRVDQTFLPSLALGILENTNLDIQNFFYCFIHLLPCFASFSSPFGIDKVFRPDGNIILAGDFNSHHPAWCASGVTDNL